jgi:hypothetical protein
MHAAIAASTGEGGAVGAPGSTVGEPPHPTRMAVSAWRVVTRTSDPDP